MKKGLLLFLGILSFATVKANDFDTSAKKIIKTNQYNEAVTFVEKGIQFHVFLNGNFDFNRFTRNASYYNYKGIRYNNKFLRVVRDYKGRIKRVGKNYIRYDYRGNVTKIGRVRLYYRRGLLKRVGGLKITYNRWGEPYFYGNVNHYSNYNSDFYFSLNIGPIFNYNDRFFYNRNFKNNYRKYRTDKNYYYYKANRNANVSKRNRIIKRRKPIVTKRNNSNKARRRTTLKTKKKRESNKVYEKRRS